MFFRDSNFCCFCSFEFWIKHPNFMDFDALLMEMTPDLVGRCALLETVDGELPVILRRSNCFESWTMASPRRWFLLFPIFSTTGWMSSDCIFRLTREALPSTCQDGVPSTCYDDKVCHFGGICIFWDHIWFQEWNTGGCCNLYLHIRVIVACQKLHF